MNANQERAHRTGWCMAPEGARPKHEGCPGCECACHVEAA